MGNKKKYNGFVVREGEAEGAGVKGQTGGVRLGAAYVGWSRVTGAGRLARCGNE